MTNFGVKLIQTKTSQTEESPFMKRRKMTLLVEIPIFKKFKHHKSKKVKPVFRTMAK